MTDRELLEAAAKAAGLPIGKWVESWSDEPGVVGFWLDGDNWNPLTDDGDALRLAVKLNMMIDFIQRGYMVGLVVAVSEARSFYEYGFTAAATRRAIVRAAAALGATKEKTA